MKLHFSLSSSPLFQLLQDELSGNEGKVEDLRQLATDICINVSFFSAILYVSMLTEQEGSNIRIL